MTRPSRILSRSLALLVMIAAAFPIHGSHAGEMTRRSIPKTLEAMKRLMGGDYTYVDKDGLLIVSDLDQKTLYQLMARDFYIYVNVLTRDFYNQPHESGGKSAPIITIFLFKSRESYVKGLRKIGIDIAEEDENNQGAVRNGYFFGGRERNFILINYRDDYERGISTYSHELSHALLRREVANPPTWLNEGIATMVGNSKIVNSHLRYTHGASLARTKRKLEKGEMLKLSQLLKARYEDFAARENSQRFYDAGELFCRFLHSRNQLLPIYRDLRDARGRGGDAEIVVRITGLAIDRLEQVWYDWIQKQNGKP